MLRIMTTAILSNMDTNNGYSIKRYNHASNITNI